MIAPQPPFRRLNFRWAARVGRFLPCADTDPSGSLLATVDGLGRTVIANLAGNDFAGSEMRIIGYHLGADSSLMDPADVLAWLTAEAKRRRQKK